MRLSPFSEERVLGLDIGTDSIKIVETIFSSGRPVALRAVSERIEPGKAGDPKARRKACLDALKKVLAEHSIAVRTAVVGIPVAGVGVKIYESPINIADLGEQPLGIMGVETHTQPLQWTGAGGAPRKGMLLVAANRVAVQEKFELAREAGLVPEIADVNIFAVLNACLPAAGPPAAGFVFVLDMGASATEMAVVRDGMVLAVRSLAVAGSFLTDAVRLGLNVPQSAAETLKRKYGLLALSRGGKSLPGAIQAGGPEPGQETDIAVKAAALLAGHIERIGAEIKRAAAAYSEEKKDTDTRISKVVLTGGTAGLPGLADFLGGELEAPVEIFQPFDKRGSVFCGDKGDWGCPIFSAAAGLSLRRVRHEKGKTLTSINLLPRELVRRPSLPAKIAVYSLCLLLLAAGYQGYDKFSARVQTSLLKSAADRVFWKAARAQFKKGKRAVTFTRKGEKQAMLGRLEVSGVLSDSSVAMAVLIGGDRSFVAKKGKLYDENGYIVEGVSVLITQNVVKLSDGDKEYELRVPD